MHLLQRVSDRSSCQTDPMSKPPPSHAAAAGLLISTAAILMLGLGGASASATTPSQASTQLRMVPVKLCKFNAVPDRLGELHHRVTNGAKIAVPFPRTTTVRNWAAYIEPFAPRSPILAPANWDCTGFIYEDGGATFAITTPDRPSPTFRMGPDSVVPKETEGIVGWEEGSCGGCIIEMVCRVFTIPHEGFPEVPCTRPPTEVDHQVDPSEVTFNDPPGVTGTGKPSGGTLPASGAVIYNQVRYGAAIITCVLPTTEAEVCKTSVGIFAAQKLKQHFFGG